VTHDVTLLVIAKAPIPGLAKTRLAAAVGDTAAADIAAAALLDTLDAVADTAAAARVVALTGDVEQACRADELRAALTRFTVIPQRGDDFPQRLANAHIDTCAVTGIAGTFQIGMDTPQVTAVMLAEAVRAIADAEAVLGPAADGGWWGIGFRSAALAEILRAVPTSRDDTAVLTVAELRSRGVEPLLLPELRDVDTVADISPVRAACGPTTRFARATATAGV